MNNVVLIDRFFDQIHLHLVSCYGDVARWPVILGIFGRAGDGKSIQLSAALERCGVEILRLNAADLESGLAGEPGKHIARTYATASLAVAKGIPSALVVDDVDTTVGEWEMNTGTVNHQQVLAELMHLADQPVDRARNFPRRVPVFVTGNNLARLYPPLRRHGRMNTFAWRPERQEVRSVVEGIFAGVADTSALRMLEHEFTDEPLSFFAQVRQALVHEDISGLLKRVGYDMKGFLLRPESVHARVANHQVTGPELLRVARRVHTEQRAALRDFLAEQKPGELEAR
jgi:ATPase family associated with various cellular activities (AAA)